MTLGQRALLAHLSLPSRSGSPTRGILIDGQELSARVCPISGAGGYDERREKSRKYASSLSSTLFHGAGPRRIILVASPRSRHLLEFFRTRLFLPPLWAGGGSFRDISFLRLMLIPIRRKGVTSFFRFIAATSYLYFRQLAFAVLY